LIGGALKQQIVNVAANGEPVGQWTFDSSEPAERALPIPVILLKRTSVLNIDFEIKSPRSQINEDTRQLGIGLIEASVS
jgi:hypothetical protein